MARVPIGRILFLGLVGLIFAFVIAPLVVILWASFFSDRILTFPPTGYTVAWFARAWALQDFSNGFITSLELGVCATITSQLIGVPAALAIERYPFPGRETVRQVLLSPMYVPAIVAGAALLGVLSLAFVRRLAQWQRGQGFASVRADWLKRAAGLGQDIRVRLPERELSGRFQGLDDMGRLLLQAEGRVTPVTAGEVFDLGQN